MTTPPNVPEVDVLSVIDELINVPVIECIEDQQFIKEAKRMRTAVAELLTREAALVAAREASDKFAFIDGHPPHPYSGEWFIAGTEFGPVVLRSLPEEYAYDYTTADHTYIMKEKVIRWMQMPDSAFIAFASRGEIFELRAERDAWKDAAHRATTLEKEATDVVIALRETLAILKANATKTGPLPGFPATGAQWIIGLATDNGELSFDQVLDNAIALARTPAARAEAGHG